MKEVNEVKEKIKITNEINDATKGVKVRFPILLKLILIISIIVFVSAGLVTLIPSWRFSDDSRIRAEKNILDINELHSAQIQGVIDSTVSGVYLLFDSLRTMKGNPTLETVTINNFWLRNAHIASIILPGEKELYNSTFFKINELETGIVKPMVQSYSEQLEKSNDGVPFVFNATPVFNLPTVGLMVPYRDFGTKNSIILIISTEALLSKLNASNIYTTFVVNNEGAIVLDDDFEMLKLGINRKDHPVVKDMLKGEATNKQIVFKGESGESYFGSYWRIAANGLGIITLLPTREIDDIVKQLFIQNFYLTAIVLLLSLLAVYFFSKTLTRPIRRLNSASLKIQNGDYNPDIVPTTKDEIGALTENFINMSKGLAERERIKTTFGKFVNKSVAEKALKGELQLGGIREHATVFFSDIRSFTAISEALSPEQVVEFLNQYLSRMVSCINETGGVVDKYIGDAIMALWGVPVSSGTVESDAFNAIIGALAMRHALIDFNKDRGTPDKPVIKIGCGINTGYSIAGQIGSQERMEYTVIGDAVNLASRIEALCKPFGCDIIISQNTYKLLQDKIIAEPLAPIKVKGKSDTLQIYALINTVDNSGPKTLDDVRKLVGIEVPGAKPDIDSVEVKYEILNKK